MRAGETARRRPRPHPFYDHRDWKKPKIASHTPEPLPLVRPLSLVVSVDASSTASVLVAL